MVVCPDILGKPAEHDPLGQLLAARGYAVLYPNIRGSSGYGQKFIELNRGDWGGGDYRDVMAGIDDLITRGIANPEKLAIGGWSYGGYMSEWAITQTTRFKAAVSGAGLSNLISEYGTEQGPAYDEWFYGVPYEPTKVAGFLNSSPFVHLKNVKTPTLILQGDADIVDPPGQSQELYRGLKRYGVETELVAYPREPHGFHEEKHLLDRLNRILAWYDKHLKSIANDQIGSGRVDTSWRFVVGFSYRGSYGKSTDYARVFDNYQDWGKGATHGPERISRGPWVRSGGSFCRPTSG